ncbi:MAG: putative phosphoesterase [Cyclobacteriaceae bacterium]|jgi:putative phosphoesterase
MKIGLISDTHNYLDPGAIKHLSVCDEIWHLGDVGNPEILEQLESLATLHAVWGNIDSHEIRQMTSEHLIISRQSKRFLLTHIAGKPPGYTAKVKSLLATYQPNVLICGHSHILRVEKDHKRNILFINPGAAGRNGFHKQKTIIRFDLTEGQMRNMEVVELGLRASI